jgi:hypothetical protein
MDRTLKLFSSFFSCHYHTTGASFHLLDTSSLLTFCLSSRGGLTSGQRRSHFSLPDRTDMRTDIFYSNYERKIEIGCKIEIFARIQHIPPHLESYDQV